MDTPVSVQPTEREAKFIRLGQIDALVTPLLAEKESIIRELFAAQQQTQPPQEQPTAADPSA